MCIIREENVGYPWRKLKKCHFLLCRGTKEHSISIKWSSDKIIWTSPIKSNKTEWLRAIESHILHSKFLMSRKNWLQFIALQLVLRFLRELYTIARAINFFYEFINVKNCNASPSKKFTVKCSCLIYISTQYITKM